MNNFIQNHKYLHNLSTLRQYNKNKFIKYFFFTLNDFTYSNFEKKNINFIYRKQTSQGIESYKIEYKQKKKS